MQRNHDYQVIKHFAVGLDLFSVNIDLDISKSDFTGNCDWQYAGALLFLKFDL